MARVELRIDGLDEAKRFIEEARLALNQIYCLARTVENSIGCAVGVLRDVTFSAVSVSEDADAEPKV